MKNLAKVADVDVYNIHLINNSADTQKFWCFLQEPAIQTGPTVFGNSDTTVSITSHYEGDTYFGIPVQYTVGAGATNKAVGLGIQVNTSFMVDANIGDAFEVNYAPAKQGPDVVPSGSSTVTGTIEATTNKYNKQQNINKGWYENMSFGIQTDDGYIGVTWDPSPNKSTFIIPKFSFYIAVGDFESNDLVDLTSISVDSAEIQLSDFKQGFDVTVTYNSDGSWEVSTGAPVDK